MAPEIIEGIKKFKTIINFEGTLYADFYSLGVVF